MYMEVSTLREGYAEIVRTVIDKGVHQSPRGMPTRAVPNMHIEIFNPGEALPTGTGRGLHLPIAAVEAVQIVGAFQDPDLMLRVSPNFKQFMDDGRFWGGYGERIEQQMLHAGHKIKNDPDTRQAVVTLWQPSSDNVPGKHDYPCTLSIVFQVIRSKLEMTVTMRSNDVWLGLAYDAFVFTQLQFTLARWLSIDVGRYHHHAVNMHLYNRDIEQARALHEPTEPDDTQPLGFGRGDSLDLFENLMRARRIGQGETVRDPTPDEKWFITRLAPYLVES